MITASRSFSFLLIPLFFSILLSSCANKLPSANIIVSEPDRIRFQGKGAGAGMMLMSSMGAMGIAIGVAIDEGIGKDIDAAARLAGFDIRKVMIEVLNESTYRATSIVVERYGFVTRSGDNDPVAAQLHITVSQRDGTQRSVKYPEDFDVKSVDTYPLEEVKQNGALSVDAFKKAAHSVLAN